MKAAHEGVPVAGLPAGAWPGADAHSQDTQLAPPLNLTGSQMGTGGRGGRPPPPAPPPENVAPQARAVGPRGASGAADDGPLPPAEIPNAGRGPAARGKGVIDKLLGTL